MDMIYRLPFHDWLKLEDGRRPSPADDDQEDPDTVASRADGRTARQG
jgi:hypothetical protein